MRSVVNIIRAQEASAKPVTVGHVTVTPRALSASAAMLGLLRTVRRASPRGGAVRRAPFSGLVSNARG
ncbi:MAG: hypothetical protein HY332_05735 [Chloroflexi bacterium]|nr:hypothetical protein [Chloroflexota bacterium]